MKRIDIHVHSDEHERATKERHAEIIGLLNLLRKEIVATSKELLAASAVVRDAVNQLPAAIDKLEADLTAAIAKLGTIPQDVQDDIDAAVENLKSSLDTAQKAVADAADGVDEGATSPQ